MALTGTGGGASDALRPRTAMREDGEHESRPRRVCRNASPPSVSGMGSPQRGTEGHAISAAAARNSASPIVVVRPSS